MSYESDGLTRKHLTIVLLMWLLSGSSTLWAQNCSAQTATVASLRSKINADQDGIRRLNPGLTADELNRWADAAEEERQRILKDTLEASISTFADWLLSAPENALKPMDIAGYHLPNGIGSLGTGQANAVIGRLKSLGVNSNTVLGTTLLGAIRDLSQISGKTKSLEYLGALSKVASTLKDTAEMGASDESTESAAAFLQLVADLAGKGDFAAQLGTALFQGSKNLFDAYLISSAVGPAATTAQSQLEALKVLSALLERDVQALQKAKGQLDACSQKRQGSSTYTGSVTKRRVYYPSGSVVTEAETVTAVLTVSGNGTATDPYRGTLDVTVDVAFVQLGQTFPSTFRWTGSFSSQSPRLNIKVQAIDVRAGGRTTFCTPLQEFSGTLAGKSIESTLVARSTCGSDVTTMITLTQQ
jgi:hypothetical protein